MATVRKDCGLIVARMVGNSSAMDRAAELIRSRARANAAPHVDTGRYIDSIEIRSPIYAPAGVRDRSIIATDPASWKIEFGHRNPKTGNWVPGQFIMTNAVNRG